MTTLRLPTPDELQPDDRQVLEGVAKRLGVTPANMSMIWRAQSHWPQHLEANHRQTIYSFGFRGQIPPLTKEAMHAAVSMTNRCEF